VDGQLLPKERLKQVKLIFQGDKYALTSATEREDGTFILDIVRDPRTITTVIKKGTAKDIALGIYHLEADKLTVCFAPCGKERPTGFTSKPEGTLFVLKRQLTPKEATALQKDGEVQNENAELRKNVSTLQMAPPLKATDQPAYVIKSRLLEAAADRPKEVLRLPKLTLDDGQCAPLQITDRPQHLLEKVVEEEKIKIGTFCDVRVKRLKGDTVRLALKFQNNEVEKSSVREIRVLGNSVQTIQDVELHKPVKIVFQKDAKGSAQRWVELTVDSIRAEEETIPPPPPTVSPLQQKGSKK
jgi:uncharacterized protein (TIGR03067 family)